MIRFSGFEHVLEMPVSQPNAELPESLSEVKQGSTSAAPTVAAPRQSSHSLAGLLAHCMELFRERTFLLLICWAIASELSFVLPSLVSPFMHSIYGLSPAR